MKGERSGERIFQSLVGSGVNIWSLSNWTKTCQNEKDSVEIPYLFSHLNELITRPISVARPLPILGNISMRTLVGVSMDLRSKH